SSPAGAAVFFAAAFRVVFLAAVFLAAVFFAVAFLAVAFLAVVFLAAVLFAAVFFAGGACCAAPSLSGSGASTGPGSWSRGDASAAPEVSPGVSTGVSPGVSSGVWPGVWPGRSLSSMVLSSAPSRSRSPTAVRCRPSSAGAYDVKPSWAATPSVVAEGRFADHRPRSAGRRAPVTNPGCRPRRGRVTTDHPPCRREDRADPGPGAAGLGQRSGSDRRSRVVGRECRRVSRTARRAVKPVAVSHTDGPGPDDRALPRLVRRRVAAPPRARRGCAYLSASSVRRAPHRAPGTAPRRP